MQGNFGICQEENPLFTVLIILPQSRLLINSIVFNFTGIQLLTLLVPILIGFLLEPQVLNSTSCSKYSCQLHEQSLQWLMRIGPKYPQEFKALMSQSTELRTKLEAAIRYNQQSTNQKLKMDSHTTTKSQTMNQPKPTIELKTNFNNFSSS